MIAADSSAVIAWMGGLDDSSTQFFQEKWLAHEILLPPAALSEVLSSRHMSDFMARDFLNAPLIPLTEGYWWRAGRLRSKLLRAGRKANLGDCLIAQTCIDAGMPLLTRDRDFEAFAALSELRLVAL